MHCPGCGQLSAAFSPLNRFVTALCLVGLAGGIAGLFVALILAVIDPVQRPWSGVAVSINEVQAELDRKGRDLDAEIDSLRALFPNFDNARWAQARPLIASWVNDYGVSREDKLQFIIELKQIGEGFVLERRAEALDAYRTLNLDKVTRSSRRVDRWLGPLRVVDTLFGALLLIGLFCVAVVLIDTRRQREVTAALPDAGEARSTPAPPTAFCTGCGTRIAASVAVCPSCGVKQTTALASS
jgi:hypothetical protein